MAMMDKKERNQSALNCFRETFMHLNTFFSFTFIYKKYKHHIRNKILNGKGTILDRMLFFCHKTEIQSFAAAWMELKRSISSEIRIRNASHGLRRTRNLSASEARDENGGFQRLQRCTVDG